MRQQCWRMQLNYSKELEGRSRCGTLAESRMTGTSLRFVPVDNARWVRKHVPYPFRRAHGPFHAQNSR